MISWLADPRRKASLALGFVFAAGVLVGVAADRVGSRLPATASATPLTVEALADSLRLSAPEREHVRQVVDSLDTAIARATGQGPESLQVTAAGARQRLEAALPPDRRAQFQAWMLRHHARMMQMMGQGGMMGSMGGPGGGMMGPATPRRAGGGGAGRMGRGGRGAEAPGVGQGGGMMRGGMQGMGGMQSLPAMPAESLPERGGQGALLVADYCGRCHGIPDPRTHRAAEWPGVLDRMLQHMRSNGVALPDSSETQTILAYLQAHARP